MKAKTNTVRARTRYLGVFQTSLLAGAAVCGALSDLTQAEVELAVGTIGLAGVAGVVATIDDVVASERLAQHYQRTLERLELIDRTLGDEIGRPGDIDEIENVLMSEHRAWHRVAERNQQ